MGNRKAQRGSPDHEVITAMLFDKKLKQKEIALKIGVFETIISDVKQKAVEDGLMDKKRNPTKKGEKFLKDCRIDLTPYYENGEEDK